MDSMAASSTPVAANVAATERPQQLLQITSPKRFALSASIDFLVATLVSVVLLFVGLRYGWNTFGRSRRTLPVLPMVLFVSASVAGSSARHLIGWMVHGRLTDLKFDGTELLLDGEKLELTRVTLTRDRSVLSANVLWPEPSLHIDGDERLRFVYESRAAFTELTGALASCQPVDPSLSEPWPSLPVEVTIAERSLPDFHKQPSASFVLTKSLKPAISTRTVATMSAFCFFVIGAAAAENLLVGIPAGAIGAALANKHYDSTRFELLVTGDHLWITRTTGRRDVVPLKNLQTLVPSERRQVGWSMQYIDQHQFHQTLDFDVGARQNKLFVEQLLLRCPWLEEEEAPTSVFSF